MEYRPLWEEVGKEVLKKTRNVAEKALPAVKKVKGRIQDTINKPGPMIDTLRNTANDGLLAVQCGANRVTGKVKDSLDRAVRLKNKAKLELLFRNQIAILRKLGYPEQVLRLLMNQMDSILNLAVDMDIEENNLPFAPVVPSSYLSILSLLESVQNKKLRGYTNIDPTQMKDLNFSESLHAKPYYILNVSRGIMVLDNDLGLTKTMVSMRSGICLTVNEAIAFAIHANILSLEKTDDPLAPHQYAIIAGNTECIMNNNSYPLCLDLDDDGIPVLRTALITDSKIEKYYKVPYYKKVVSSCE